MLVALMAVVTGPGIRDSLAEVQQRQTLRRGLDTLVANAGGPTALAACGTPRTSLGLRAPVAWRLDVPMEGLDEPARPPGVILRAATATGGNVKPVLTGAQRRAFRLEARARGWELWTACR